MLAEVVEAFRIDALLAPIGLLAALRRRRRARSAARAPARRAPPSSRARRLGIEQRSSSAGPTAAPPAARRPVEDDDAYTGATPRTSSTVRSRSPTLGVDEDVAASRVGALLHDVGKITVPKEIINKPGPARRRRVEGDQTHTVEGEAMLAESAG